MKIGLIIIATNNYISFLEPLIKSADQFFLKDHDVTYFIFSNKDISLNSERKIITNYVEHKDWPWMTLGRYDIFTTNSKVFVEMDYLFYCDVDMRFESDVDSDILDETVVTQHPGFYNTVGTPERRTESLAYIDPNESNQYFAGGFNGGSTFEFLKMSKILSENIKKDYKNGIIAVWHDESHLNKYFFENPPKKILNPSYCYAENMVLPFEKKLVALVKDHDKFR
jgi:histo-blood group ABO system transferase